MQYESTIVVLGAKASKGEFNGRPYRFDQGLSLSSNYRKVKTLLGLSLRNTRGAHRSILNVFKGIEYPFKAKAVMQSRLEW